MHTHILWHCKWQDIARKGSNLLLENTRNWSILAAVIISHPRHNDGDLKRDISCLTHAVSSYLSLPVVIGGYLRRYTYIWSGVNVSKFEVLRTIDLLRYLINKWQIVEHLIIRTMILCLTERTEVLIWKLERFVVKAAWRAETFGTQKR
jgi:hypothetical protein